MKNAERESRKYANDLYNNLIDNGYFTEKELQLITDINGYNIETLNNAIYARYGYRDYKQLTEEE